MKITDVPRPSPNVRLGFHYYPDEHHYRVQDLQTWLPRLRSLGARWLTVRGSMQRAIPEAFISGLLEAGIEPIIHIPALPIKPVDLDVLSSLARVYSGWGAHYLVLYDRPNSRKSWQEGDFDRGNLVDQFLDIWMPAAHVIHDTGMRVVLPPLEQGGTYWDIPFLSLVLDNMINRAKASHDSKSTNSLLDNFLVATYAFAGPHSPDWGRGGKTSWPKSRPYMTPTGSQDQLGFWSFEWYSEVIEEKLGDRRPILMIAGGAKAGEVNLKTDEDKSLAWHTSCNLSIARAAVEGQLPEYLLNVSYWLLCAETDSAASSESWYQQGDGVLPIVREMQRFVASELADVCPRNTKVTEPGRDTTKSISHYVLLPMFESGPSEWHWRAAGPYVRKSNSSCGYSSRDAAEAKRVTLIGTEQQIAGDVEKGLRDAGCQVERVAGVDYAELSARLAKAID